MRYDGCTEVSTVLNVGGEVGRGGAMAVEGYIVGQFLLPVPFCFIHSFIHLSQITIVVMPI
jgi:hypothetical protein